MFLLREKVSELSARIDWLHDDFTTELNSLVQDFTWQQGTLLDQIASRQGDTAQYLKRSREVQNEQQQVYTWHALKIRLLTICVTDSMSSNQDVMTTYRWKLISVILKI